MEAGQNNLDPKYIAALVKNIEALGYSISEKLAKRLSTLDIDNLSAFYEDLIVNLKALIGANVRYKPMYPNFPKQVEEMSKEQLFTINAVHYLGDWIGTRIMPDFAKEKPEALSEKTKLKVIDLGSEDEFEELIKNILSAKASLSETDKKDIEWAVKTYAGSLKDLLPEELPHKENMTYISGLLLRHVSDARELVSRYIRTSTDVLRLITAMSDGDVSLSENTKFKSFKRNERRFLLELLENCGNITEDMLRHKNRWIRVGERLHPFEYKKRFPKTAEAFDIIRNDKPFETFNRKLEKALLENRTKDAVKLLETRPGEFARRMDYLLREAENVNDVLGIFSKISDEVSTKVLLQVIAHFEGRNRMSDLRVFFPKGNVAKAFARENNLIPLDQKVCLNVIEIAKSALRKRFTELEPLGGVYLDESLKNFNVPLSQRSASKSLRTVARGSKLAMTDGNTVRFFLWWKEGEVNGSETGRVDIDLSGVIYDENWQYMEHISYTNLKSDIYKAAHSGDITSAPYGACEFIDLDIPSILKYGARYAVMSLHSYTRQPFCNLPECYAGWMMRQKPQSGEIFEPKTVEDKIDVTANTTICIPVILDLREMQVIWTDLALTQNPYWYNNIEGNQKGMTLIGQAMTSINRPDLHTLFSLHAEARGWIIENKGEAETIFSEVEGITPFDTEKILSEFL